MQLSFIDTPFSKSAYHSICGITSHATMLGWLELSMISFVPNEWSNQTSLYRWWLPTWPLGLNPPSFTTRSQPIPFDVWLSLKLIRREVTVFLILFCVENCIARNCALAHNTPIFVTWKEKKRKDAKLSNTFEHEPHLISRKHR